VGTRGTLAGELSRRDFLAGAGALGLSATIASALPYAARMAAPDEALADGPTDGTLQAFFDTIIPGKPVPDLLTELGNPIDPKAIAGVDAEHGAVYTDALALAQNPLIGFSALEPPFLADLQSRSLAEGGLFLDLDYDARERVCLAGLDFSNSDRVVWEASAAIPFTAFCAAANVVNATSKTAAGYAVMGHPGTAPDGYADFSYRMKLNRGRTKRGSLQ
jgi:enediyne biosynthesis protein E8